MKAETSIIPAAALKPGPATIVVRIPSHPPRVIRSCVAMVEHRGNVVQVAFLCGYIVCLSARTAVGVIQHKKRR